MVMEFVHGVKVDNVDAIRKMGFDTTEVAQLLIENFSDQVFVGGFLHSDPHPGNVFVRPITLYGRTRPQ
jgi:predicted unusual protein kinase regulating ubiquinone biosynthesis (AarF/ABC1/UbiB family)